MRRLALLLLVACSSSGEPAAAKVEQALAACPTPAYVHTFSDQPIASVTSEPDDPSACPAVYYSSEPRVWSLHLNAPAPKRADGKCSCRWLNAGLCYNTDTGEGPSIGACYNGACQYYRAFECGYSTNCAHKVTYSMSPAYSYTGSWSHTQLRLVASEPGCRRTIVVNDFHTMLP